MKLKPIGLLFILFLTMAACQKESATLSLDSSWADITIQGKGLGLIHSEKSENDSMSRLQSYREAKTNLYKKLETEILNLKIDSKRDVKTFIGDNNKLKEKVSIFLKGTRITEAVYTPRKGMELSGELYLGESFKSILGLMEKKTPDEKGSARPQNTSAPGSGF